MDGVSDGTKRVSEVQVPLKTELCPKAEEFSTVKSKKKRNKKYLYKEKTVEDYLLIYNASKVDLSTCKFYEALLDGLNKAELNSSNRTFRSIRCLALGKLSAPDRIALWQLSLLGLLVDHFGISWSNVTLWDPVFEPTDTAIIEALGGRVDDSDHSVEADTLLYLPHAPVTLIDLILKQCPSESVILGNNVLRYDTKIAPKTLETRLPTLHSTMRMVDGSIPNELSWDLIDLPDSLSKGKDWFLAFNDLALHIKGRPMRSVAPEIES
jgi:SRR1